MSFNFDDKSRNLYFYTEYCKASVFVWFNALISGTASLKWKNIFVLDSSLIEVGYIYNIKLRHNGAE